MTISPPGFCIRLESRGAHTLVTMEGELDLASRDQLRNHFQWFIDDAAGDVDLDLAEVTFLESTGLGAILTAHATLRDRLRTLRIVRASPQVTQLFELCGIAHLIADGESVETWLGPIAAPGHDGCRCMSDFGAQRETRSGEYVADR